MLAKKKMDRVGRRKNKLIAPSTKWLEFNAYTVLKTKFKEWNIAL